MIKSRRMRWARHVASMGEMRNAYSAGQETWREETTQKTYAYMEGQY
jgi:hypothetical protein